MSTVRQEEVDTLIVLARGEASLYDFLKPRQEAKGRTIVILDRRQEARPRATVATAPDRRRSDRRSDNHEAALALMSVLGFMVLHRDGPRWAP